MDIPYLFISFLHARNTTFLRFLVLLKSTSITLMSLLMNSSVFDTSATGPLRLEKQGLPRAPRTREELEI